jgi:hypothetical protein
MVFAGGTILYAASKIYSHARSLVPGDGAAQPTWMEAAGIDESELCDAVARIELVERLALVGQPWCVELLHTALRDERDRFVRTAIKTALETLSP